MPFAKCSLRSTLGRTRADVVVFVGFELHVVQRLAEVERHLGERDGVVAFVAVVEAHFEFDTFHDLGLDPVGLRHAEAVEQEPFGVGEVEDGERDVPDSHAVGLKASGDEFRCERCRCLGEVQGEFELQ